MMRQFDGLLGLEYRQERKPSSRRRRQSLSMSAKGMSNMVGMMTPATTMMVVVALWAVCWLGMTSCSRDLVETEIGWQFEDDGIDTFDGNTTTTANATTAAKVSSSHIALINSDFELTNVTGNSTVNADNTTSYIVNWMPGGAGVQILMKYTYNMAKTTPSSVYCIHLNNPLATGNGTQGSLATTLATPSATGKTFTVQYDTARNPDGPINLWPALKVSAIEASVVHAWEVKNPVYNVTDAQSHITWQRQSFVYTGTGAQTVIKFESMSEKYGPLLDNVAILSGKHELSAAPPSQMLMRGLGQRSLSIVTTVVALSFSFHSPHVFIL